jgi:hypothetical protein
MPRRNPLDPYAFDTESRPFTIPGRVAKRDEHTGVHTTSTPEQAAAYAVQRAMIQGDTVAIVFELDVDGLEPLPDVDAAIQSQFERDMLNDIKSMLDGHDEDEWVGELEDALMFSDGDGDGFPPDTWVMGAMQWIERNQNSAAYAILRDMGDDVVEFLKDAFENGLPPIFWADVVDQRRFMVPIGLDRVTRILALRPIRNALWGEGNIEGEDEAERMGDYPEDNPEEPVIFTREDFYNDQFMPDYIEIYTSGTRPTNAQYHGTDLTRARKAFPELGLENPWGYTQEPE